MSLIGSIFINAAFAQKALFVVLAATTLLALLVTIAQPLRKLRGLHSLIKPMRVICPMLGVLCASLNGYHMMQTTLRLPFEVTTKMLAPGMMEMAALVSAGALAGLVATVAHVSFAAQIHGSGSQV